MPIHAGPRPKVSENDFKDLLGQHSFTSKKDAEPKTIADMRRKQLEEDTDPDKLKVNQLITYCLCQGKILFRLKDRTPGCM